ncbi:MAG: ribbon-helix-helix protein, CopG family [Bryobacteraceae bacterium]
MEIHLPPDLIAKLQHHLATGRFPSESALIEHAVRRFLDEEQRSTDRLEALRRIGHTVDEAGLYERIILPDLE